MPVAIITGASRGLGRALAHGLAGAGWRVVVDARNAAALTFSTPAITALAGDVTDPRTGWRWSPPPTGSAAPICWSTTPASSDPARSRGSPTTRSTRSARCTR
ncbi:SDR family NAD(P)-dependent oxidoreductase [Phytohabitans rumicis]|uniref:SDR family NAD(P)-dependent oxidoreductase n=1 Tax=Phytohabitans rumicis TaxID=1076125 RepID=UPI002483C3F3|nr:SDR family NAD(P)-dependent oxidoreductase [Phytohabitans rumicis]